MRVTVQHGQTYFDNGTVQLLRRNPPPNLDPDRADGID
jgi:hypothetical protein